MGKLIGVVKKENEVKTAGEVIGYATPDAGYLKQLAAEKMIKNIELNSFDAFAKLQRYKSANTILNKVNNGEYVSSEEIEKAAKTFKANSEGWGAKKNPTDFDINGESIAENLLNAKKYYSLFEDESDYKKNKNNIDNQIKYADFSFDDLQNEITAKQAELSKTSDKDTKTALQKEIDWLENFSVTRKYATEKEYDTAIEKLQQKIKDYEKKAGVLGTGRGLVGGSNPDQGKIDELEKQIENLKLGKSKLERQEELNQKYYNLLETDDLKQKLAEYNKARTTAAEDKKRQLSDMKGYVPDTLKAGPYYVADVKIPEDMKNLWNQTTDDEKKIFTYLSITQSKKAALEFLQDIEVELSERDSQFWNDLHIQEYKDGNTWQKIKMNIASVPQSVLGNISAGAEDIASLIQTGTVNPYSSGHALQDMASITRQLTAEEIDKNIDSEFLSELATNTYQGLMSSADMTVGGLTLGQWGYSASMALGAFSSQARSLYERGESTPAIALGATLSALVEFATETVGADRFLKTWNSKTSESFLKNLGIQLAAEPLEEVASNIGNMVVDAIVTGQNSEINNAVRNYIAQGYSEDEAKRKASGDKAKEIFWEAYSAFISVGFSSVGSATKFGVYKALEQKSINITAKDIVEKGNADILLDIAKTLPTEFTAYKTAENFTENDKSNVKKVAKLYSQTVDGLNRQIAAKTRNAVSARLRELGYSGDIYKISDIVLRMAQMQEVERSEIKKVQNNEITNTVYTELISENKAEVEWVKQLSEETKKISEMRNFVSVSGKLESSVLQEVRKYLSVNTNVQTAQSTENPGSQSSENDIAAAENSELQSTANADMTASGTESVASKGESASAFDEPSAEFPPYDVIQDTGAQLAGVERHSEDQYRIIEIGRKLGYRVRFDAKLTTPNGKAANGIIDTNKKIIYINPTSKEPIRFIIKHELTHYLEKNFSEYVDFANAVMDSEIFKKWITAKGYASTAEYNSDIVSIYVDAGIKNFGEAEANYEIFANVVGDKFFSANGKDLQLIVDGFDAKQRPKFIQAILDFISYLTEKIKGTEQTVLDLQKLEKRFIQLLKETQAKENTAEDGGGVIKYSFDESKNTSIKQQLKEHLDEVNAMQPVAMVQYTPTNKKDLRMQTVQEFKKIGYQVDRQGFGIIEIGDKQIEKSLEYITTDGERAALLAVPKVLKRGMEISGHKDHKGRSYGTITIAAPISINGRVGNVAVVVKITGKNRYSTHRILMPDGSEFIFEKNKDAEPTSSDMLAQKSDQGTDISSASNNSIIEKRYSVNTVSAEALLERYENGEITREEYLSRLRGEEIKTPVEIANMKKEDANTTPPLKRRKGKNYGDKESKFYGSLLGSSIFDDAFKAEVENDTFIKNYQSITNKQTLKKAAAELDAGGQAYVKKWERKESDEASLIDIAVGLILIDRYQRVGDYDSAVAAAEKVREFGTASGRQVQIFSILGRLDPNSMTAYAQKELNKAFRLMADTRTQKWIDANQSKFELTDEDIEFVRRRTLQAAMLEDGSRQKAILLAEICTRFQDKIPPESGQAIRALQRTSMLLNVKTNLRNITGNAGMVPVFIASDFFGSGIDRLVAKKTGVRTTGNFQVKGSGAALKKGLYESWDDFRRGIRTKQEELDRFDVNKGGGKNFNEHHDGKFAKQLNAVAKKLNEIDDFTSFCLEAGDRPFFEMWMNNSLNNQLRLNNVTVPTPDMLDIARTEALQRTWQDNNKFTRSVSKIKDVFNGAHLPGTSYGLGDFVYKFVKTPANLAKAIVEFSPAGFAFAGAKFHDMEIAMGKGQFTPKMQKEFVRSLSNAITGTIIYALVAVGAGMGVLKLSGGGDDDKDVSNFEKYIVGIPPYSINLFGVNVTYDWMQPVGSVLAIVADFMENRRDDPEGGVASDILSALKAGGDVFTQQSFLQSLYDVFSSEGIGEAIFSLILSEPAAFIPQRWSQMASLFDKSRRTTYDSQSEFKTAINKIIAKIPGLRQMLPEQVNVLGETAGNTQYLNPWEAFAAPGNTYPKSSGEVAESIYELYKQTGNKSVMPRVAPNDFSVKGNKIVFSPEEKADFQRRIGSLSSELLSEFFSGSEYEELSDEEKIDVVSDIYSYATARAKAELDYDYEILSAMVGKKKDKSPILTKEKYDGLNDKARKYLAEDYFLSKKEMKYIDDAEKLVEYYIERAKD